MRTAVRVSSLPANALEDLRSDHSWALVQQVVSARQATASRGAALSNRLYEHIGHLEDAGFKSRLVALRRSVHGGRRLKANLWNDETRAVLGPDLASDIAVWDRERELTQHLVEELPGTIEADYSLTLERLLHWARTPAFQFGLAQGSETLFDELSRWRAEPRSHGPGRSTVDRLAKYMARTVAKTSPYSTFMISGLLPLHPGPGGLFTTVGDFAWTSVAELNLWMLQRITNALSADDRVFEQLRVGANPSLDEQPERLTFLASGPQQAPAALRRSEGVETCVNLVRQNRGTTVGSLVRHLRSIDPGIPVEELRGYVRRLVTSGALYPLPPFDDQELDPLQVLADWLDEIGYGDGHGPGADLSGALREIRERLFAYPKVSNPDERSEARRTINRRLRTLVQSAENGSGAGPLPRKNLFYENAVFTKEVARCAVDAWDPVLSDLSAVRRALSALDTQLPARQALGRFFVGTYGPEAHVPWFDFYKDVTAFVAQGDGDVRAGVTGTVLGKLSAGPMMSSPSGWGDLPFAREQSRRQESVTRTVFERAAETDGVARLSPDELTEALGSAPGAGEDSLSCYLQLLPEGDGPAVVLNNVTSGYGRGLTRLSRLEEQAGTAGDLSRRPAPVERGPLGELLIESTGSFSSNLNLRTPGTVHTLDVPFTSPGGDTRDRLPLNDLEVTLSPTDQRVELRSVSLGERVRLVHGGLMAAFWMPPPLRHLLEVFGAPHTLLHSGIPLFVPRGGDPARGVRQMPRVEVGSVVLSRRCWVFGAFLLPRRAKGEEFAQYWLRLATWMREHDLPERFFARSVDLSGAAWRPEQKSRKPVFVDVRVQPLLASLDQVCENDRELIVLTEALPDLPDAPVYGNQRHVTELIVELPAVNGG